MKIIRICSENVVKKTKFNIVVMDKFWELKSKERERDICQPEGKAVAWEHYIVEISLNIVSKHIQLTNPKKLK